MKNEVVIVGSGGFGREILWLIHEINQKSHQSGDLLNVKGFISSASQSIINDIPVLGDDQWAVENLPKNTRVVIAIGNPDLRRKLASFYQSHGFKSPNLIHPNAIIGPSVQLGEGNLICAGAVLTTDITLGDYVIINLNATVGHDTVIGDFTTISPGANISGEAKIESDCEIGSGAVLLPGVHLEKEVILGAGAVATRNLSQSTTYIGIPARPMFGKLS